MPGYTNPVFAPDSPSKAFLDRADSLGLKIILTCPDLYVNQRLDSLYLQDSNYTQYDSTRSHNGLNYYGGHPALLGFAVTDEPTPRMFSDIGNYFADIEQYNPTLLRQANLLPAYANDTSLGFPGMGSWNVYPQYIENYITSTNPNILSFDSYPILFYNIENNQTDTIVYPDNFFYNLDVVAQIAESHQIPWFYIPTFLSLKSSNANIMKNVNEMRYVVYGGLIHGIKGLNYWHAGNSYHVWPLIEQDTKDFLREFHKWLSKHEEILLALHYSGSYHVTKVSTIYHNHPIGNEYILDHMLWSNFAQDASTQKIFRNSNPITAAANGSIDSLAVSYLHDGNNGKYFWVFNKSLRADADIFLHLKNTCSVVNILDDSTCLQTGDVPVHLAPGEAKLFRAFFSSEKDTLHQSTVWRQRRVIGQDLVIDSLVTLTVTDTLFMADNARIIVRPGGKLVVDGGTLTSACDAEMWPGITVLGHSGQRQIAQNQGCVELRNGAVIEHARCGITLGADEDDLLHTGGILSATDASFRNCARAINFRPYADTTIGMYFCCRANKSFCTRVTFVVDSGNRFAQNNTAFGEHLLLQGVYSIKFQACSLLNVGFVGGLQNCGIRALGATFGLRDDDDLSYPPNPNIIVHRSLVSGFHYGVHASGTAWRMGMGPGLLNTVFRNNIYGAHLHDCQYTVIERCSFHLDSLPYSLVRPVACGVYLSDSYGAEFEGDTFIRAYNIPNPASRGIHASNNTKGDVIVYHNLFENLTYGIHAAGNNGDSTRGLLFSCNEFLYNNYGIYIPSSSTVAMRQKYRGYSAANSFTGVTNYGIYNAGPQNINYYNSTVGLDPSLIYGSVTQHYGATSGGCFFSWDTIGIIAEPEPIKTEGDSTADNANIAPPKSLSLGGGSAGTGLEDVRIFPNPAQMQVTVVSEQGMVNRIRLYDVYGKLLKTVKANANMAEVDVHELCAGVYVLRVETDSGAVVKRVVKE